jgi:hypothetical protein
MNLFRLVLGVLIFGVMISFIFTSKAESGFFFNRSVRKEVETLFSENYNQENEIIRKEDLVGLPDLVQRWLKTSQIIGNENISALRLKQEGEIKIKPNGNWMTARAKQYFTTDEPGFIWQVKVNMAPLLSFKGRDKYYQGQGHMLIKLLSLITVADAKGDEIDQGTLLRYLGEIIWFPTAALSDYIQWEEIDSNLAKATMNYGGVKAFGFFHFNDRGEVIKFTCERYYSKGNNQYSLEKYKALVGDYKEFAGLKIPSNGEAIWELEEGDYSYYKFEITEVEYNKAVVY